MEHFIRSMTGQANSLQITELKAIPAGDFNSETPVLVKNITEDNISIQVRLCNQNDFIETILYPGWNVELIVGIKGVSENTLQYGY